MAKKKTRQDRLLSAYNRLEKMGPDHPDYFNQCKGVLNQYMAMQRDGKTPDFDLDKFLKETYAQVEYAKYEINFGTVTSTGTLENDLRQLDSALKRAAGDGYAAIEQDGKSLVDAMMHKDFEQNYAKMKAGENFDIEKFTAALVYESASLHPDQEAAQKINESWQHVASKHAELPGYLQVQVEQNPAFQKAFEHGNALSSQDVMDIVAQRAALAQTLENDQEINTQIQEAIQSRDLSFAEKEKIMEWATFNGDPAIADKMLRDLIQHTNGISPEFETNKDKAAAWKALKEQAGKELQDLQKAEKLARQEAAAAEKALNKYESWVKKELANPDIPQSFRDKLKEYESTPEYVNAKKELDDRRAAVEMAAAKVKVQTMVDMHARTELGVARAAARDDALRDARVNATKKLEAIGNEYKDFTKSVERNTKTIMRCAAAQWKINFHEMNIFRDMRDSFRVNRLNHAYKNLSETRQDIDKQQQKIIALAQKQADREYKRSHPFKISDIWNKGAKAPDKITFGEKDYEKAAEYLRNHKPSGFNFDGMRLKSYQHNLDGLLKQEQKDLQHFEKRANLLEQSILQEREFIQSVMDPLLEMQERGELGQGFFAGMAADGLNDRLSAMLNDTQLNFSDDLLKALDADKMHMQQGNDFKFANDHSFDGGPGNDGDLDRDQDMGPEL